MTNCKGVCYTFAMAEIILKSDDLLDFTEAASILGVSRPTIYNLIAKYKLHPVTIGRNRYLLRDELQFIKGKLEDAKLSNSQS